MRKLENSRIYYEDQSEPAAVPALIGLLIAMVYAGVKVF